MSFYYTRVPKEEEEKVVGWGFKKVSGEELSGILDRLTRPTYNSRLHTMEITQAHNYKYPATSLLAKRSPSSCERRRSASAAATKDTERRLTDRELQRVVRRLRKPTLSSQLSRYDFSLSDLLNPTPSPWAGGGRSRTAPPDDAEDRRKAFVSLSRPTTASRAKTLGDCILCADQEELELKNSLVPFQYEYGDERGLLPEEVEEVVERISAPTLARRHLPCPRATVPVDEWSIRQRPCPLVSGLARSRSVREIVQRLHAAGGDRSSSPGTGPHPSHRQHQHHRHQHHHQQQQLKQQHDRKTPAATEVTHYE